MIKKTVTEKKIAANRTNAKRSTGPRTDWGKSFSRFNAIKSGLFADEIVIPKCDGEDACRNFSIFLQELREDFEPVGALEKALVETIAQGFWRLRRATRAEYGATRVGGQWDRSFELPKDSFIGRLNRSVDLKRICIEKLTEATQQIRHTGKLPKESYDRIRPFVDDQHCDQGNKAKTDTTADPVLDDDFIQRLEKKTELLRSDVLAVELQVAERDMDFLKEGGIPQAEEMEKIFFYRMRTEKEIDWALRTLFFMQDKRKHKKRRVSPTNSL